MTCSFALSGAPARSFCNALLWPAIRLGDEVAEASRESFAQVVVVHDDAALSGMHRAKGAALEAGVRAAEAELSILLARMLQHQIAQAERPFAFGDAGQHFLD